MLDHKLILNNSLKAIENLTPSAVWKNFLKISQVPRESKKEGKMIEFIKKWCEENKFDLYQDKTGNSIIKIPASKGYENSPCICLQGHIDMVCEKLKDKEIDFLNDPIELMIFEDKDKVKWIKANGTTLGADNGIAIAASMTIAEDKNLIHGPLELLFTIDEETGLTGAFNLESNVLKSKYLLNLDSEDKGVLTIGCAGGIDSFGSWLVDTVKIENNNYYSNFKLEILGLKGGHSGVEINEGRANGIKLMGRLLKELKLNKICYVVKSINGGSKHNAIPREVEVNGYINKNDVPKLDNIFKKFKESVLLEYKKNDGDLYIKFESNEEKEKILEVFSCSFFDKILNVIYSTFHGVYSMSPDIPSLVETSTNLAIITTKNGIVEILTSQRSMIEDAKFVIKDTVCSSFKLAGAKVVVSDGYPGWKPDVDSKLLQITKDVHKELFGNFPKVEAIHAGLECGIIISKYPGMEAISFGPTIKNPHTPDEKLRIDDAAYLYDLTCGILKKFL